MFTNKTITAFSTRRNLGIVRLTKEEAASSSTLALTPHLHGTHKLTERITNKDNERPEIVPRVPPAQLGFLITLHSNKLGCTDPMGGVLATSHALADVRYKSNRAAEEKQSGGINILLALISRKNRSTCAFSALGKLSSREANTLEYRCERTAPHTKADCSGNRYKTSRIDPVNAFPNPGEPQPAAKAREGGR